MAILRMGMHLADVIQLMEILVQEGFNVPVVGVYDGKTREAVRLLQTKLEVPVDGVWGPITEGALRNRQQYSQASIFSGMPTYAWVGLALGVLILANWKRWWK